MNDTEIIIEPIDSKPIGFEQYSGGNTVTVKSSEMFKQSLDMIEVVTNSFVAKIHSLATKPSDFEVEFGIAFKADLGAIIAKTSAEANFKIKLTWKSSTETK